MVVRTMALLITPSGSNEVSWLFWDKNGLCKLFFSWGVIYDLAESQIADFCTRWLERRAFNSR